MEFVTDFHTKFHTYIPTALSTERHTEFPTEFLTEFPILSLTSSKFIFVSFLLLWVVVFHHTQSPSRGNTRRYPRSLMCGSPRISSRRTTRGYQSSYQHSLSSSSSPFFSFSSYGCFCVQCPQNPTQSSSRIPKSFYQYPLSSFTGPFLVL